MECKEDFSFFGESLSMVLIETLWNVKEDKQADVKKALSVLIETLWNVKIDSRIGANALVRY